MKQIYVIKNIVNDKVYVGQAKSAYDRFRRHRNNRIATDKQDIEIVNAMKEIGAENFYFILLENCEDDVADEREKYYIKKFDSYKNGYNHTIGGLGTNYLTDEDIQECRDLLIMGKTIGEIETITHINHKTLKRELEKRIPNYKDIMKQNIQDARWMSKRKPVNQYDLNGNFIRRFECARDALDSLGKNKKSAVISNCCKHKQYCNTAYGYKWEYAKE